MIKRKKNHGNRMKFLDYPINKKELENKFNNPDLSQDDINKLSGDLQKIIDTIDAKEARWFELSSKLED